MIFPYVLYEREIKEKFNEELYNPDLKFFFDKGYRALPNITKPNGRYYAVTADNGTLLGYMFYYYEGTMIIDFHIVWFARSDLYEWDQHRSIPMPSRIVGSMLGILRRAVVDLGITDIFLSAVDQGVLHSVYARLLERYFKEDEEWNVAGVLHNRIRLEDGKLYDKIYFELHLSEETIAQWKKQG